jgi:glucosamine--fructose-6-phosphate aminotransferase (isomerizing)
VGDGEVEGEGGTISGQEKVTVCGIFGYVGNEKAIPILLEGLKKLEYRGYDSAGIATVDSDGVHFVKEVGYISNLENNGAKSLLGNIGIAHCRWATHGGVTRENAHPHFDCGMRIAVVHNGIIENHQELRGKLTSHKFISETDTEVIPHLIEQFGFAEAIKKLDGSYAVLAISANEPNRIWCAKKDSPLVIGVGGNFNMVSSDCVSLIGKVKGVIFLQDGDTAVVDRKAPLIFNNGNLVERIVEPLTLEAEDISAKEYGHFMLKEIMEQPQALMKSIEQDERLFSQTAIDILRARQVVLTACGTSRYAAIIGRYLFSKIARRFCEVVMASEFQYFADSVDKDTVVIAVSQSGETADVLEGLRYAKNKGARIISILNTQQSSIGRISDRVIGLNCGAEIGVASTKAFTTELVIFYLLAFAMVNQFGAGVLMLVSIPPLIEGEIRKNGTTLKKLAKRLSLNRDIYYIARGINFALAGESALKMKEISYIHAEGMPAGELKHGTLALIEGGTPVVALCPSDYTFAETLSNVAEAKARGAYIIGVSDKNDGLFDSWVRLPQVDEIYYPLVTIVPMQLLAYYTAVEKGLNPDRPRNLAKAVTVK